MSNQLLLLEDVEDLGRSGDLVNVKPGFARNFLLPQKKAVVADTYTLRLRARLQEERKKLAESDRTESNELAQRLDGMVLRVRVKVDPDGHMYGSVSSLDIVHLCEEQGIKLERRFVLINQPIKALGTHLIKLKLKEGVPAEVTLKIISEMQTEEEEAAEEMHNNEQSQQEE